MIFFLAIVIMNPLIKCWSTILILILKISILIVWLIKWVVLDKRRRENSESLKESNQFWLYKNERK